MIIYFNGIYGHEDQVKLSPSDRGFLLGDGVFETVCVDAGRIECLEAHEKLLRHSAAVLRIPYPENNPSLQEIIFQLITVNHLSTDLVACRITLTRGEGKRGLMPSWDGAPTLMVSVAPFERPDRPWRVTMAYDRVGQNRLSSLKHLGYQQAILARLEAHDQGYDEALFLNHEGHLVRGTTANVFVYHQGQWLTPPIQSGARPGVMRGRILQKGLARVRKIDWEKMGDGVESMVLTNSLMGIQLVQMLEAQELNLNQALALQDEFLA